MREHSTSPLNRQPLGSGQTVRKVILSLPSQAAKRNGRVLFSVRFADSMGVIQMKPFNIGKSIAKADEQSKQSDELKKEADRFQLATDG